MVKGVDILIKIGTTLIAAQKGASLERTTETIDTTTKSSEGWKEFESSFKSWSIECEGLYTFPGATDGFRLLETAYVNGEKVTVEFAMADDNVSVGATVGYSGSAIITSFPIEAPIDDSMTFSLSLQGSGALTEIKSI